MKTLGQIRRAVRDLIKRVSELERKVDALIEMFCKDSFESVNPPTDDKY